MPERPRFLACSGLGIRPACGHQGVLSPEAPRAQEGDKRKPLAAHHQLGERVLRVESLAPSLDGARPFTPPEGRPERARPFEARRWADMPYGLPSHQVSI